MSYYASNANCIYIFDINGQDMHMTYYASNVDCIYIFDINGHPWNILLSIYSY